MFLNVCDGFYVIVSILIIEAYIVLYLVYGSLFKWCMGPFDIIFIVFDNLLRI